MEVHSIEIERLRRLAEKIYEETQSLLVEAAQNGSLMDRVKAIETATRTHDYLTTDLVRSRITRITIEAANCLSGAYENREVELAEWAAEATSQMELNQRAAEILKENKGYFT